MTLLFNFNQAIDLINNNFYMLIMYTLINYDVEGVGLINKIGKYFAYRRTSNVLFKTIFENGIILVVGYDFNNKIDNFWLEFGHPLACHKLNSLIQFEYRKKMNVFELKTYERIKEYEEIPSMEAAEQKNIGLKIQEIINDVEAIELKDINLTQETINFLKLQKNFILNKDLSYSDYELFNQLCGNKMNFKIVGGEQNEWAPVDGSIENAKALNFVLYQLTHRVDNLSKEAFKNVKERAKLLNMLLHYKLDDVVYKAYRSKRSLTLLQNLIPKVREKDQIRIELLIKQIEKRNEEIKAKNKNQ